MSFLARRAANFEALCPLTFLRRTSSIFPERTAIVYDDWKGRLGDCHSPPAFMQSWAQTAERCTRLASALAGLGVGRGDSVAVLSPNTPAFVEAHHAINAAGGAINPLNIRLDASTIAYILEHSETKVLLADTAFASTTRSAIELLRQSATRETELPIVVDLVDPIEAHAAAGECIGQLTYEELVSSGSDGFEWRLPEDEWDTQAINYTSGTTGRPKGVLYHHRGAVLNAINNALVWGLEQHPTYLWTLPMFHCNGWCFPYTITMQAGTHVCLRSVESSAIFSAIGSQRVSHLCGAPIVMNLMLHAPSVEHAQLQQRSSTTAAPVKMFTAGAPPPAAVIEGMEAIGFDVTHVYGLTEVYGPAVSCPWQSQWDGLSTEARADIKAQQGVGYPFLEGCRVVTDDMTVDVPRDGTTLGEVLMRGNVVMKGYLKDETATESAFEGGWFHSGDLAVVHPSGYLEIKDRAKDIIISGGENISTVEVESVLYRHPAVLEASVVARPDSTWGEVPCAFVVLKDGVAWGEQGGAKAVDEQSIIQFCRGHLAHFKAPKHIVHAVEGLPKTSTGKVQKFELREKARTMARLAGDEPLNPDEENPER